MKLFLIGNPAAGKSTVGKLLASSFGCSFEDTDDLIAQRSGRDVAEFVRENLSEFRVLEAQIIAELAAKSQEIVVATGGGAATFGDNLARMREQGLVVALTASPATSIARARADVVERPLLRDDAAAEKLWRQRGPIYRQAHVVVASDEKTPQQVCGEVVAASRVWQGRESIVVSLGERSYPIVNCSAVELKRYNSLISAASKVAFVYDANLREHATDLLGQVANSNTGTCLLEVPSGESSKSFEQYQRLSFALLDHGLDRNSLIIAIGGGVVGDLAGFVASTLLRGVAVIHVPTTLIAMTDSAIGGKTAIDLPQGKNQIGTFWQPHAVLAGLSVLTTLPARERRAGFGELWKYALLDGEDLWQRVAACASWANAGGDPPPQLREVIQRAAGYKAAIVGADETEKKGLRHLLNLGHTVGHAIEAESGLAMAHGEAVGLGLLASARISARLGYGDDLEPVLTEALAASGLATNLDQWLTAAVFDRLYSDKKRVGKQIAYIAIWAIGDCRVAHLSLDQIRGILRFG